MPTGLLLGTNRCQWMCGESVLLSTLSDESRELLKGSNPLTLHGQVCTAVLGECERP